MYLQIISSNPPKPPEITPLPQTVRKHHPQIIPRCQTTKKKKVMHKNNKIRKFMCNSW